MSVKTLYLLHSSICSVWGFNVMKIVDTICSIEGLYCGVFGIACIGMYIGMRGVYERGNSFSECFSILTDYVLTI